MSLNFPTFQKGGRVLYKMHIIECNKDSTEMQYKSVQNKLKWAVEAVDSLPLFDTPF